MSKIVLFLLLAAIVILTACGSDSESEVKQVPVPADRYKPVTWQCKEILAAKTTLDRANTLARAVYAAVEKRSKLSSTNASSYGSLNITDVSDAMQKLEKHDEAYTRWSDAWENITLASQFFGLIPNRLEELSWYIEDPDWRYRLLRQLRAPVAAISNMQRYAQMIARENNC